jgi:hypothetical protein
LLQERKDEKVIKIKKSTTAYDEKKKNYLSKKATMLLNQISKSRRPSETLDHSKLK